MKANSWLRVKCLIGATLFILNTGLHAAPLTWFPGPPTFAAMSGAAAVANPSLGNFVIGGDGSYPYPEYLNATNQYWSTTGVPFYATSIAGGAVASGDYIMVYGGTDGTVSQNLAINYSPSGDGNVTLASMSVPRSYLGYASDASGTAYAIGGLDDSGNPLASAESLNQDNTNWTPIASLPVARYDFPAVFDHTNRIYIFGGRTNTTAGTEISSALYYSVRANSWTAVAPMPIATARSAAAFGADGNIYVVGGVSSGVTTNVVQVYNPASDSWVVSTPLTEALSASAMNVDSLGRLIVIGGMDTNGNDVADVWRSQQLSVPDSAPVFTEFPRTNDAYGQQYSSSIAANGNPQPTYSLLSGPTNFLVDLYSGAITWTPRGADQIGTIPIIIQAKNYAGSTNLTFDITVTPPPPTIPTNLMLLAATDTSVTLGWSPEDPLVGPVTFKVYRVTSSGGGKGGSHVVYSLYATTTNNSVTIALPYGSGGYGFVVTATAGSHTTGYSYEIGVSPTGPQPPPNVRITGTTSTTLTFAWDASPGPATNPAFSQVTSYTIGQYIPGSGVVPKVTGIPTNILTGTVTGLKPGFSAFWVVQAFDNQGFASSATVNIITAMTPAPAQLSAAAATSNGGFQFSASQPGAVNQTVTIQATTNPADPTSWETIGSFLQTGSSFTVTDTNAALYPNRFYRVATP